MVGEINQTLNDLRQLSIVTVEGIVKWRNGFINLMAMYKMQQSNFKIVVDKSIYFLPYIWNQLNYLLKIQTDLNYL